LFLNIIMIMPASQNRSNCAFRCGLLHLATKSTAKSGIKVFSESKIDYSKGLLQIPDNYQFGYGKLKEWIKHKGS